MLVTRTGHNLFTNLLFKYKLYNYGMGTILYKNTIYTKIQKLVSFLPSDVIPQ